jgi:hypothetical protein
MRPLCRDGRSLPSAAAATAGQEKLKRDLAVCEATYSGDKEFQAMNACKNRARADEEHEREGYNAAVDRCNGSIRATACRLFQIGTTSEIAETCLGRSDMRSFSATASGRVETWKYRDGEVVLSNGTVSEIRGVLQY